jgi:nucleoside-diphosphate-sugar epimerase
MAYDAYDKRLITVNGGKQKRCHIHIRDIIDAYRQLLLEPAAKIAGQAFNFVAENQSVLETANIVSGAFNEDAHTESFVKIRTGASTDDRSYTVDGTKAREVLRFVPRHTVYEAARSMAVKLRGRYWPDIERNPAYFNMAEGLR